MRIFLLAGEPSGDLHGAKLANALRALHPQVTLCGVGGVRMRQAGVQLLVESDHWGTIGIAEAVRHAPFLLTQIFRLARLLRADPPDLLVTIDFGAFNVQLIKRLQGSGIRTLYYIPPGCWNRRRAAGKLPWMVAGIATPFPWSAENLRAAGAPAHIEWVGHPLLDYCHTSCSREEAQRRLGIDSSRSVIALAPGSRQAELHYIFPVFIEAMRAIEPAPQVLISVAPNLGEAAFRPLLPPGLDYRLLSGLDYDLMQAADGALVASGTATLELAILGIPMVVAYRGSTASWVQYKIVVRSGDLKHISLPNIIADDSVVPELLHTAANPAALAATLTPLLRDTPERRAQLTAFADIRGKLGDGHACLRTAQLALELCGITGSEIAGISTVMSDVGQSPASIDNLS